MFSFLGNGKQKKFSENFGNFWKNFFFKIYLANFEKKFFSKVTQIFRNFFCFPLHKKLIKSCSLNKIFFVPEKKVVSLKKLLFLFSQKDIHTAFWFLFSSVLLSCYHHLKAKLGMYFAPSILKDFLMVWFDSFHVFFVCLFYLRGLF